MYSCEQSNLRLQLGGQALEGHHYGGAHARASPASSAPDRAVAISARCSLQNVSAAAALATSAVALLVAAAASV